MLAHAVFIDPVVLTPEVGTSKDEPAKETVVVTAPIVGDFLPSVDDIINDASFLNIGSYLYNTNETRSSFWQSYKGTSYFPHTSLSATPTYVPVYSDIQKRWGDGQLKLLEAGELEAQRSWEKSIGDNLKLTATAAVLRLEGDVGQWISGPKGLADATFGRGLENSYKSRQNYTDAIFNVGTTMVLGAIGGSVSDAAIARLTATEGLLGGPVLFKAPPGATAEEIAQLQAYIDGANKALDAGYLSPTGRVSTKGMLSDDAQLAAAAERARAAANGTPYQGFAGHVPDTTWTGNPEPFSWLDMTPRLNSSLGGQARHYPIGYKPTLFGRY